MPNNVIPFPTTPVFQRLRKRGALSDKDRQERIVSNLPALLPQVERQIVRLWRRQVPMGWIAKMHQLRIAQVEACIWVAYNYSTDTDARRAA